MVNKKRFWVALLALVSVLLNLLAHRFPHLTEAWFSQGVYRVLATTYGRIFGVLPFSVSQFLIIVLPVVAVMYFFWEIWNIFSKSYKRYSARLLLNVMCAVGVISFMFTIFAGLNYARPTLDTLIGLEIVEPNFEQLTRLAEILVKQANEASVFVSRDEHNLMTIQVSHLELARQAQDAFRLAAGDFPVLRGYVPLVKPIIYSQFMSHLRITGIYSPFTMEAHVNVHVPDYHIPATMIHELAHFRGIMREDEANFIAWLAGTRSGNPYFEYSGAMLALSHTLNRLHSISPQEHARIVAMLNQYVLADFVANTEYWQQFTGPLADISTEINDAYLRANQQADGVASYGGMIELLIAYTHTNPQFIGLIYIVRIG